MVYTLMPGQYTFVLLKNNQGFSYIRLSDFSCQGVNVNTVSETKKIEHYCQRPSVSSLHKVPLLQW